MKKFNLFLFFYLVFNFNLIAQNCDIKKKSENLKLFFEKSKDNEVYKYKFFNEFPNDFECFNKIYGGGPKPYDFIPGPLYKESYEHILLMANLINSIPDTIYYNKIIQITQNSHWDADAISYFQDEIIEKKLLNNKILLCKILLTYDEKSILSFWQFYFDGPHPVKSIPKQLKEIQNLDSNIYTIMVKAHQIILKNCDYHGK